MQYTTCEKTPSQMMFSKGNKAGFLNSNRQKNNMNMESSLKSRLLHKIYCSSSPLLLFTVIRVPCLCFNNLLFQFQHYQRIPLVHYIMNKTSLNFSSNLLYYYQDKRHNQPTQTKEGVTASRSPQTRNRELCLKARVAIQGLNAHHTHQRLTGSQV